jgi:hypothetical protein
MVGSFQYNFDVRSYNISEIPTSYGYGTVVHVGGSHNYVIAAAALAVSGVTVYTINVSLSPKLDDLRKHFLPSGKFVALALRIC